MSALPAAAVPPLDVRSHRIVPLVVAWPIFLQNLDTSVMTTALPSIAASLGAPVLHLNLAIASYLVSLILFLPVSAWLAERFGPRRVFCAAIVLFALASALCGMARTLPQLVVFRLLQGVGGALMVPVGRLLMLRSVPAAQMVRAMIWFTVPGTLGRLAGPLFGGAIVTVASWPWIFLVNIPFGIVGVLAALHFVPQDAPPGAHVPQRPDLPGLVLLTVAFGGVLGALELAGKPYLSAGWVAVIAAAGVLAWPAYLARSRRQAQPLIDFGILRFTTFRAQVSGGMPVRTAMGALPFLVPLLLQLGFGLSPLASGLVTMGSALGSLFTRTVVARAIVAVPFRTLLTGSAFATSACYAAYAMLTPHTPAAVIFAVLCLGGLCTSMTIVVLNTMGFSDIPHARMGHASTLSSMSQQLSVTLGVVLGAGLLSLVHHLRGAEAGPPQAVDFPPVFLAVAAMTLLSCFAFARLPRDTGEELRRA